LDDAQTAREDAAAAHKARNIAEAAKAAADKKTALA